MYILCLLNSMFLLVLYMRVLCKLFVISYCMFLFFVFKQMTAYVMRISDWSSDVCSSDLAIRGPGRVSLSFASRLPIRRRRRMRSFATYHPCMEHRSEERSVGKECVSTCRSRRWTYH